MFGNDATMLTLICQIRRSPGLFFIDESVVLPQVLKSM